MHLPSVSLHTFFLEHRALMCWEWLAPPSGRVILQWPSHQIWQGVSSCLNPFFLSVVDNKIIFLDPKGKITATAICQLPAAEQIGKLLSICKVFAPQYYVHGVLLRIRDQGVLLLGAPNTGKSRCAMELLQRQHRLVCDDAPYFSIMQPNHIVGYCPGNIFGLMAIRGVGIVDIRQQIGYDSVIRQSRLNLIIQLKHYQPCLPTIFSHIPKVCLPLALYKNAAMLIESTVNLCLRGTPSHASVNC